jgi:putative phage-type endonuclease
MDIVSIEQGSKEWHDFRRTHGTASEAATIIGCAKFDPNTWLKLWRLKVGQTEPQAQNWAMARGLALEPATRAWVIQKTGINFVPAVGRVGILSASFDGISDLGSVTCEIKNPTSAEGSTWQAALLGDVEPHYMAQVQQQLLVSGAERCLFVVDLGDGEHDPIIIEVLPDREHQELIRAEWLRFWKHVEDFSPPEPTENDIVHRNDKAWVDATVAWRLAKVAAEKATKALDESKTALASLTDGHASQGHGVRVQQVFRKGSVDYSKVPEIADVDLEQYRKKGSSFFDVREVKG